jgi:hypothetical protein
MVFKVTYGLIAAIAFAALAGCGSSGSGASTGAGTASTPTSTSKSQFVKQANAICAKRLKEKDQGIKEAFASSSKRQVLSPSPAYLQHLAEEALLPPYRRLLSELQTVGLRSGDTAVKRIVAEYAADLERAEEEPRRMIATSMFKDANNAAEAYGLARCTL